MPSVSDVPLSDDLGELPSASEALSDAEAFPANTAIFADEVDSADGFRSDNDGLEEGFLKGSNEGIQSGNYKEEGSWGSEAFYNPSDAGIHQSQRDLSDIDDSREAFHQSDMSMDSHSPIASEMDQKGDEEGTDLSESDENLYIACTLTGLGID